jgi:stage II sporulation protein D
LRVDGHPIAKDAVFHGAHTVSLGRTEARQVEGDLIVRHVRGGFRVILRVPLEEYVAAALEDEAEAFQEPEALKAMAVTVRSYVAANPHRHGDGADLCDGTHCQRLHFPASQRMRDAANATQGEIVWYRNKPAQVFYHENCGGATASAASVWGGSGLPYLISRRDKYCERGSAAWRSEVTKAQLVQVLASPVTSINSSDAVRLRVSSRNLSGRVSAITLGGKSWTGARFRDLISGMMGPAAIRSARFEIVESGDHFTFLGRGAGHGVGLCQHGALARAEDGQGYLDILAAYFPGTQIGVQ